MNKPIFCHQLILDQDFVEKQRKENEGMGIEKPIEYVTDLIPCIFDLEQVESVSRDYSGLDNKNLNDSANYKQMSCIRMKSGDSMVVSIPFEKFTQYYEFHRLP